METGLGRTVLYGGNWVVSKVVEIVCIYKYKKSNRDKRQKTSQGREQVVE